MSILISGASGLIGRELVENLSKKFKIFAVYNSNHNLKKIKNVIWLKHNFNKKFTKKLDDKPNYIIHCAVDQKYLKKNKKKYINLNVKILKNLIDLAKNNQSEFIMNLSSIDVYGKIINNVVIEKTLPNKPNIYGKMKFISEQMLFKQKINFINLRLPGVMSRNNEMYERPWLKKIIKELKENKNITVYNVKKKFNNIINTDEITRLFEFIVKKKITVRDTFNFAAINPINLSEILEYIKRKLPSDSKIKEIREFKKISYYISVKKLEKKLKFKPLDTKKIIINSL